MFRPNNWTVIVPYNGRQSAQASKAATLDWKTTLRTVDPNLHDIGLLYLDTPIRITPSQCPVLAKTELADRTNVVNIGRIRSGTLSTTDLFVGSPVAVTDGAADGYPFDYSAMDVIESGDSGGPDELPNSSPHLIVAVNSGGGSGEVLARTDPAVVYQWIMDQIVAHGGGCHKPPTTPPDPRAART